jgi:hypothetical protein
MAKPAITKRATKGSALTYNELDTNFQNLDDATITLQAGTGGTNVVSDLNGTITLVAGTNVTLAGNNTAKTLTINSAGGEVFDDKSPQLGADLDVNGFLIKSNVGGSRITLDANLTLTAPAGYSVYIDGWKWPEALPDAAGGYLRTNTAGVISVSEPDRLTSNDAALVFSADSNGPNGVLNVARNLQITTTNSGQGSNISLVPGGSGDIRLTPASGKVTISAVNFPTGDGTTGQTLVTNGTGQLSWANNSSIETKTTSQLETITTGAGSTDPVAGTLYYNSDARQFYYWGGWTGTNSDLNLNFVAINHRSKNPTEVTWTNSTFTNLSWYGFDRRYDVHNINYQASNSVYIEVGMGSTNIGRRYTLIIYKTGSGTIYFGQQGSSTSGVSITGTGWKVVDIEWFGGNSLYTINVRI